jgi:hypothetical protein
MQNVRAVQAVNGSNGELRSRIGALDHRRVPYKGWVIVEPFGTADGSVRSFCIMQRDEVKKNHLYLRLVLMFWRLETRRVIPYRGEGCSRLLCNRSNSCNTSSAEGSEDRERVYFRSYDITDRFSHALPESSYLKSSS